MAFAKNFKNVIVLVPDGCDETVQTLARWYKGEDLQVDKMDKASQKQHMANSVITGSAAAATAFATGHKTTVRFLGVGPRTDDLLTGYVPTADPYAPVASVLEAAQLAGKATGLVATSRITHATPAAFASHIEDRGWDNDIMEHMVYNNVDVVFGGGARHLIPKGEAYTTTFGDVWDGRRTDGENLMQVLLDRDYTFVDNKDDMLTLTEGPVWGLFDDSHMDADIDRQYFHPTQPSIAEMTAKAIELLSQNPKGFFLMVEGSQVDWAGHNNDPIYMVTDFLAFDDAVKVAKDFADSDGDTLVLAYPDHNTGGMKIGHYYTPMHYTATTIEDLVNPLKGMKITSGGLVAMLPDMPVLEEKTHGNGNPKGWAKKEYEAAMAQYVQDFIAGVEQYWSLTITEDDVNEILELEPSLGLNYALARVISKNYTVVGWTTHGHNGETVPVWVYGAEAPARTIDNTELAFIAAGGMGVDLDQATDSLYVDVSTVVHHSKYEIDESHPDNPVLKIKYEVHRVGWKVAEFPISKDFMVIDRNIIPLPGLTVYAPATGKVYVSEAALASLSL